MIPFWKIQASGNDFIVCKRQEISSAMDPSHLAKTLCQRKFAIGADGLILLEKLSNNQLRWEFYNSDGSLAAMCGNASRAIAKFAVEILKMQKEIDLHTDSGVVKIHYISGTEIEIQMSMAEDLGNCSDAHIWDTGVPHSVIETKFDKHEDLLPLVKLFRYPSTLNEKGANVSFWFSIGDKHIKSVSFERGVEGFTLACGTGACACALDAISKLQFTQEIELWSLDLPGGSVKVRYEQGKKALFLIGDAEIIFKGEWRQGEI